MTTMTTTRTDAAVLRQSVLDVLHRIAPELVPDRLQSSMPLRDQVDLASLDWVNFLAAVQDRLGVEIPEADYEKLATFDDLLAYLAAKLR
jgi:acyl carrier protein